MDSALCSTHLFNLHTCAYSPICLPLPYSSTCALAQYGSMSTARTPAFATAGGSSSAVATPTVGKEVPAPVLRETSFERLLRKPWFKSFVAGSGFMSDSYDLFVIDTVNNILKLLYGQTPDQKAGVSNAALVGSVLGQVFFGLAGDMLGRRVCFIVTSVLIIVGALGSASATAGGAVDIYLQLCIWRGLLGFGVGGEYPLSATLTSEGAERASRGRAVSAVFSMQGIGKLLGSIVNYAVLAGGSTYYAGGIPLDSAWRFSLAFGAVPALLTCYFRWQIEESDIYKARMAALEADNRDADAAAAADTGSLITTSSSNVNRGRQAKVSLAMLWEYRWVLLGTAGTWFLLDVTFYGQGLMNTTVVQQALTRSGLTGVDALRDAALGALAVVAIALPGYFVAYLLIDKMGRFPMQVRSSGAPVYARCVYRCRGCARRCTALLRRACTPTNHRPAANGLRCHSDFVHDPCSSVRPAQTSWRR